MNNIIGAHSAMISFGKYLLSQRRFARVTGERTKHADSETDLPASILLEQVSHADVENWRLERNKA
jgi:hypothetical protein